MAELTDDLPGNPPAGGEAFPHNLKAGQTVSMKLRPEDVDHIKRIHRGLKTKPNMNDLLRHTLAYTRKNQFFG